MLGALIINWSGKQLREGSPAVTAESLFGYMPRSVTEEEDYEMTPEESIAHLKGFMQPKIVS